MKNPYRKIKIPVVLIGTTIIHRKKLNEIKKIKELSKEILRLDKMIQEEIDKLAGNKLI